MIKTTGKRVRREDGCTEYSVIANGIHLTIADTEVGLHISRKGQRGIMAGNTWIHWDGTPTETMTDAEEVATMEAARAFRAGEI